MRRVFSVIAAMAALAGIVGGAVFAWRRNPRIGTAFVNSVVNPRLVQRGLAGGGASEIGRLEHIGRTSGVRRLTPVHPEPTRGGFRILVPLGAQSQWARNVLAAGHCRLQLHDLVYELDEPTMIAASQAADLPRAVRAVISALGFEYLVMRTFGARPGTLEPAEGGAVAGDAADLEPAPDLAPGPMPVAVP